MIQKLIFGFMGLGVAVSTVAAGPGLSQAAILDPLVNGSFEQQGAVPAQGYDWQNFGSGYSRVGGGRSGQFQMQVQNITTSSMSGAYQRVDLGQATQAPVFVGAYVKGDNIQLAPGSYFGASLYAEIHLTNGQTVYWNTVANSGTFDWRWIGFNTGTVSLINAPIDYMFIVPSLVRASGTAYFDDVVVADYTVGGGAVTLMFDDGPVNTYTRARPVMDLYGYKGSAAIVSSYVGTPGYMTTTQIDTLYKSGWEVVSHGVNHADFTAMTPSAVTAELTASKAALAQWSPRHFALPYGAYTASVLAEGGRYYNSVRAFELGSNPAGTFPFEVKVRGFTTATTLADVQQWLLEARTQKRWQLFVFHDIANTGDDAYHTPIAQFKQIVQAIAASGLPVLTYDQAFAQFAARQ